MSSIRAQQWSNDGLQRLQELTRREIDGRSLVVLANREPYAHELDGEGNVVVTRPASGLVTGVEPILRACGGTWIAHGGGSADRACSDAGGRVAVPPEKPDYVLRRLWIADEEYEKYYSGFANEALWPLCHLAYTQPVFRSGDWSAYQSVNRAFARAAVEETGDSGFVLVQDYHFALAPRMIRERAPQLVTSIFWHIPWPNWEVIGICPWKEALLDGMLGADIVGLQTRQHCLNFLEAAERFVRCRVNREEMTVEAGGHLTRVRAYPISVEWPYPSIPRAEGKAVRRSLGIGEEVHVSLGVDRADYTKGLIERVAAIEHLLEEHPALAGRYVHVQLASPTRSGINRYRQLSDELQREVDRVNDRFATAEWKPIVLQMRTFSCEDVRRYYSMANSALVTPLHDGMNLVAKEYVASCQDEDGLLVLSTFAGAAKELAEALLVNPYDTGQVARAILRAIRMPADERRSRMAALRNRIARNSIYDWAAGILRDMCAVRSPKSRRWLRPISARDVDRAVEAAV